MDAWFAQGGLGRSRHTRQTSAASPATAGTGSRAARPAPAASRRLRSASPLILQVPAWSRYPWLVHGFSTRAGGLSTAYSPDGRTGELNLTLTAGDSAANVRRNRQLFLQAIGAGGKATASAMAKVSADSRLRLLLLRQIHSGLILAGTPAVAAVETQSLPRGDGWIVAQPGLLAGIQTADCLPILVADVRQRIVAAFHAGWRGTLARIAERGVGRMRAEFASRPEDLTAAVGPGIGVCCYPVGEEVRMEFESQFAYSASLFREVFDLDPIKQKYPMLFLTARAPGHSNLGPAMHLDLAEANRRQLLDAGVRQAQLHVLGCCTACDTARFFSYRAEHGFTGRMMSAIGIRA